MTYEDHAEQVRPLAEHRGRAKYLTPILRMSPTCQHPETKHGANSEWSWVKCLRCGQVDQIPKMPLDQLHHWNQVLAFQKPNYETRQERRATKDSKKATKGAAKMANPLTPGTSSAAPPPATTLVTQRELLTMDIGTPPSGGSGIPLSESEMEMSDREMDVLNLSKLKAASGPRVSPPAPMQRCPHCPHGGLQLYLGAGENQMFWMCSGGIRGCPYQAQTPHTHLTLATGVRLCVMCQRGALQSLKHRDRDAFQCPLCGDMTLAMEWEEVQRERRLQPQPVEPGLLKPGFRVLGWLEEVRDQLPGLSRALSSVVSSRSVVCSFYGSRVPEQLPVRLRSPLRNRVVASNPEPGIWNLLQIDRSAAMGYDLGAEITVYVVQEFGDDFLDYVVDQDLDPIEVTMDRQMPWEMLLATRTSILNYVKK